MGVACVFETSMTEELCSWIETNFILAHPFDRDENLLLNYGTPVLPTVATIGYLIFVFVVPKYLDKIKAKPITLKPVVALWNLGLSIFSLCVLLGVAVPYYRVLQQHGLMECFSGLSHSVFPNMLN